MKFRCRILSLLAAVLIFAALGSAVPAKAATDGPILATTDFNVRQGEEFTTTLYITEDAAINTFQVTVSYDTDLVQLVSATKKSNGAVVNTNTPGKIIVSYAALTNSTQKTDVVQLTFRVDDNIGVGKYNWLSVFEDANNEASSVTEAGDVSIPLTTSFPVLSIYEMGDVNLDGTVKATDVAMLLRYLGNVSPVPKLSDFQLRIADAEKDGEVNMRDVVRILRHTALYTDDIYGDRINIYFYDHTGTQIANKSVVYGGDLTKIPEVPVRDNYDEGRWSASKSYYAAPTFTDIEKELHLYAFYGEYQSDAIKYYKQKLTDTYYSGDLASGLSGNLNLVTTMDYQSGYHAAITWQSSSNYVLNSTTGVFTKPTYPEPLTLTAKITSYDANNAIEAEDAIEFTYQVPGMFSTPTKAEIKSWLENFFLCDGDDHVHPEVVGYKHYLVNYNLDLPRKVSDENFASSTTENFEVRIEWVAKNANGENSDYVPITYVGRKTTEQSLNLVATVTFNGEPIEGDGKIYIDNVEVTPITEMEIRNQVIREIANNVSTVLTDGTELWHGKTEYDVTIQWITGQKDIAEVENNVVSVKSGAVNGALVPLQAIVSYNGIDEEGIEGQQEFTLSYTASVYTSNNLIEPGPNMDEQLYIALKDALYECNGFTGNLTTDALKAQEFVSLDLTGYADKITSLNGLAYCTNLRALNISGIKLTGDNASTINQIASLPKLEALIAKNCGLSSLSESGTPVLKNAIYLELLDLSNNNFTNLNSVLDEDVTYGHLQEVYLANNKLESIAALSRAPGLSILSLANNGLDSDDIQQLVSFPYLNYLSLADNRITDIKVLENLTNLVELRLQNNQITDVSPLRKATGLHLLYLSNNQIKTGIYQLGALNKMEVLYLNDNPNLPSISDLNYLNNLKAVNVSNTGLDDLSVLQNSRDTLEEIYAENNELTSFNFADGMVNLRVLMLSGNAPDHAAEDSNLTGILSKLTKLEVLTLSDKPLLDLKFLQYMPLLARLDIANCGLTAYSEDGITNNLNAISTHYGNLKVLDISNNNFHGNEAEIVTALKNLSALEILYMDNTCSGIDVGTLLNSMNLMRYLSMENCSVADLSWMSRKRNLVFVDLAGSELTNINLNNQITSDNIATLEYLYLDTNTGATFENFYNKGIDSILKELSLENVSVPEMRYLPTLENLTYLNLKNTGLTNLTDQDERYEETYTIARYPKLQTLDLTNLKLDLAPTLDMPALKTLYAVDIPENLMFYKNNLHTQQKLYNKGVTGFLYNNATVYKPVAQTEGTAILNLIPDFTKVGDNDLVVTVAADGILSDNNPELPLVINDYAITWTISNEVNYEIVDGYLSVKSYENIDDEALTLTASITPYDDQEAVTRSFTFDIKILRPSSETRTKYYLTDTTGFGVDMAREYTFQYDFQLQAAKTDGFTDPVKPVVDEIIYDFTSVLENGEPTSYPFILTTPDETQPHSYQILATAPLHSQTTIQVDFVHYKNGETVVDDSISQTFTVKETIYTITYVVNGGTVTDSNNLVITTQNKSEESVLFSDIKVERLGYIFEGWYTDEALTELYWLGNEEEPKLMPRENLTLYAKWKAHSFNLIFDANGGSVGETSRLVLCDTPFGELPTPTRDYYTFKGWFTAAEDGEQITAETALATAVDVTVYAHWELNPVSGWVLRSEMPEGAEVVSEKWRYTRTTNIESTETSVAGYTQTGSYWVQSGSGSTNYASFPSGFDTTHSLYTNIAKAAYSSYENATNKRVVTNNWAGYIYWHWMYNTSNANGTAKRHIYNKKGTASWNNYGYKYFGAFTSTNGNYSSDKSYCCGLNITNYIVPERTSFASCQGATRWFRFDYYTSHYTDYYKMFQYRKVEEGLESATQITASDTISNVQNLVQYRPK